MIKKFLYEEKGLAIVIVSAAMTAIMGVTALVVDIGTLYLARNQLVNACDAAALAGAWELPDGSPGLTAKNYLEMNTDPQNMQITVDTANNQIKVKASEEVELIFARVLGFNSGQVSANVKADRGRMPPLADYALFSKSSEDPLYITTDMCVVNGDVHTNDVIQVTGDNNTFNGVVEYVEGVPDLKEENGNEYLEGCIETDHVSMPDYSPEIEALCSGADIIYGNLTINEGYNLDRGIYVQGDVTINADNLNCNGGYILADGDININGNEGDYLFQDDSICFYSKHGNINLYGDNLDFNGILYAPEGQTSLTGDNITINGSVMGNTISYTEAAQINRDQDITKSIFSLFGQPRLIS
ncbi:MAG: hypothetical protein K9L17_10195 [Clostridiales bacterium]|nr:hypothetical protein [Clostridiales bacterium]MCF8023051.1 hypothetical protein [Clostridiales bacterium]